MVTVFNYSLRSKGFPQAFFVFYPRENWGAQKVPPFPLPAPSSFFCARPNFRAATKRKMPRTDGRAYGNACYAGQLIIDRQFGGSETWFLRCFLKLYFTFSLSTKVYKWVQEKDCWG